MAKAQAKAGKKKTFKRKERRMVPQGIAHIQATFNNTVVSITDLEGNLVSHSSAGALGFHGSRKGTPFAAQQAAAKAAQAAREMGMQACEGRVNGPGWGRESAGRVVQAGCVESGTN